MNTPESLRSRCLVEWRLKCSLGVILPSVVLLPYAWVQRHPVCPVADMVVTAWDRSVPYTPGLAPLYLSLWVMVPWGAAFLTRRDQLWQYTRGVGWVTVLGVACFVLMPTQWARPTSGADSGWLHYVVAVDRPLNACPSLHAAFVVYTWVWARLGLAGLASARLISGILAVWGCGILYSTIAVRQHGVLDLCAGIILGVVGVWAGRRFFKSYI